MPTNIEIKARVRDRKDLEARISQLAPLPAKDIEQEDTFFRRTNGRLKLRIIDGARGELIHYFRNDEQGPKSSRYTIVPVPNPTRLRAVLGDAYGIRAVVLKKRHIYVIGNTRIHFDAVEGLGEFLELEVVLREGESEAEGTAVAQRWMKVCGIADKDLVQGAYVDLLDTKNSR